MSAPFATGDAVFSELRIPIRGYERDERALTEQHRLVTNPYKGL